MHAARSVLTKFAIVATCIACSSDSLTDPFAPPGLALKLSPSVATIFVGGKIPTTRSVALTLTATSLGRSVSAPSGVEWTSSNPNVAFVDSTGVVTAGSFGTATVTARVNNERATATVIVSLAPPTP